MEKVWLLYDVNSHEYRIFKDEAALNKFTANKYGHVEGQVQKLPDHIRTMELAVFNLENVHYAYAH